ncbi:MAG: GAF domain-containing protein [Burkholderiaceae bacterium]
MIAPPFLEHEQQRLETMNQAMCAFVPREERFDRVTRLARRLLDVPIALISIVEKDVQWFRSAQGLTEEQTGRDISFCGHALVSSRPLVVPDALQDPRFWDNPLVTGEPGIRSYLGIPLAIATGMRAGTLCAIDTRPRAFTHEDIVAMQDLARIAEAELKLDHMAGTQKQLLVRLTELERRGRLDPVTGCWNVRGLRELLALAVEAARTDGATLGVCYVRVANAAALGMEGAGGDTLRQLLAQVLRRRLPESGALALIGASDFCAVIPGATPLEVEERLAEFTFPKARLDLPGMKYDLDLELVFGLSLLHEKPGASATELWGTALARLPG